FQRSRRGRRGRPHQLRNQPARDLPSRSLFRGPDPKGRQACRFAGGVSEQARTRDQYGDGKGARPERAARNIDSRRRGARLNRREFIALLGRAAAAWPVAARAQQPAVPVIGFLGTSSLDTTAQALSRIKQGLAETGFVEPRNIRFEYRWANDQ